MRLIRMIPGPRGTGLQLMQSTIQPQQKMKTKDMTTLRLRKLIGPATAGHGFVLIPLALVCFALSPLARAVSPAPDGGYPGANTAEGTDALFSLTTCVANTAIGFDALFSNTTGRNNTANGIAALRSNTSGTDNTANGGAALLSNTSGDANTANGVSALFSNLTGSNNTANGFRALLSNT